LAPSTTWRRPRQPACRDPEGLPRCPGRAAGPAGRRRRCSRHPRRGRRG
jgi:hypothetical protein